MELLSNVATAFSGDLDRDPPHQRIRILSDLRSLSASVSQATPIRIRIAARAESSCLPRSNRDQNQGQQAQPQTQQSLMFQFVSVFVILREPSGSPGSDRLYWIQAGDVPLNATNSLTSNQ